MIMPRSAALFGSTAAARNSNLVEFRAGKMIFRSSDNMVLPDKRSGKLYLHQSEDGLMHLCWKERNAIHAEDDFLIFPEDAIFVPVKKCTSGRVYLLRFKAGRKFFFWMQEPNVERDADLVKKINDSINNPPSMSSSAPRRVGRGGAAGLGAGLANSDMQDLLGSFNLNQSDLLGLLSMQLGGEDTDTRASSARSGLSDANEPALAAATAVTPAAINVPTNVAAPKKTRPNTGAAPLAAGNMKFRLEDLQNIFSTMGSEGGAVSNLPGGSHVRVPLLPDVLKLENIKPLLESNEAVERLLPHVPEASSVGASATVEEKRKFVMDALQSPFFKAAIRTFSSALQSGEIGPVVSQFKLGDNVSVSASEGDLVRFAEALEANEKTGGEEHMEISAQEAPKTETREPEKDEPMDKD